MKILRFFQFTFTSLLLWGCGQTPGDESHVKIRQGAAVSSRSTGPERVSTVGIIGIGRDGQYTCSAALISSTKLVTAAHCLSGSQLYAFFGTNLATARDSDIIPIRRATAHPDYLPTGPGLPAHDVAVVTLSRAAPSGFKPIAILPDDASLQDNTLVLLAGYGITEYGGDSGLLRATPATFVGLDSIGRLQIDDPERRGACSGDSGGPLFALVANRYYVAGVLSGGPIPCRGVNAYTSLAQHRDFIEANAL